MRKPKEKPGVAKRFAKYVVGGAFNLVDDVITEAVNTVPGYPKCESYGQYCRRNKNKQKKRR